jgi:phosphatidate cytidylyltransferase
MTRTQQKKLAKEAREAKKSQKAGSSPSLSKAEKVENGLGEEKAGSGPASEAVEDVKEVLSSAGSDPVVEVPATGDGPRQALPEPSAATSTPSKPVTTTEPAVTRSAAAAKGSSTPSSSLAPPGKELAPRSAATSADEKRSAENAAYWKKVRERAIFGFLMIGGFILAMVLGHPYMIVVVIGLQTLVYREVTALFEIPGRPSITGGAPRRSPLSRHNSSTTVPKIRIGASSTIDESAQASEDEEDFRAEVRKELVWSKTLSWYFFTVANYFLYGESLIYYFKHIVFIDSYFLPFAKHHRFLSFLLYIIGFVGFVSGLRRENLKHQFGLFGWVHMSLLLIVFSSHFLVNNILEGLIWLFLPASLVICNDVFAYVCGMIWGRTPLISLSPKKTVEGFVGAFVITEVFALVWATIFQRSPYLICPAISLGMNAFQDIHCTPNSVFEWVSSTASLTCVAKDLAVF